jgi:UDP-N-acetylmuramoylalanine--D-glutamate ligase
MRNREYFKNKKVTVVGLARSGVACANLLYDLGANISITDNNDSSTLRKNLTDLKSKDIKIELGQHSKEFIKNKDLVVVSPGVPDSALPFAWAEELGIPVISEIEVAWVLCPATVIAVTGSNGKTTVTTLIGKILEKKGERVFVCGNIGRPFTGELHKMKEGDFVSLEISSFQLETIRTFKPKIALILNITTNHLDRYGSMQEYIQAKKRIYSNQDASDYLVLNYNDPILKELSKEAKAKVEFFSEEGELNPNQAAVLAVGSILGIEKQLCSDVFADFKGIEHRMEFVAQKGGVKFINDSKATTVESAIWALKNILEPIIWIAGGRHKGIDYKIISDLARKKVKKAILIGEAKEKIKDAFKGTLSVEDAATLEEAVRNAFSFAQPGDCVLLSPMCSSYDMFSDYEERGRVFKKAVLDLLK